MNEEIIEGHAQIYAPTVGWHEIKLKDIPGVMFALSQARQSALEEAKGVVEGMELSQYPALAIGESDSIVRRRMAMEYNQALSDTLAAIEGLIKKTN